jgi:hypothetical protein
VFTHMDRDNNAEITYDELVEGCVRDPMIMQVRTVDYSTHTSPDHVSPRS